jgi:hypothetical protein
MSIVIIDALPFLTSSMSAGNGAPGELYVTNFMLLSSDISLNTSNAMP